ncbi:MAG: hypothetical protein ABI852_20270, partial [Gemmatimonadaceae bacterium]
MIRSFSRSQTRPTLFAALAVLAVALPATSFGQAPATTVGAVASVEVTSNDTVHTPTAAPTPAVKSAPAAVDINFG